MYNLMDKYPLHHSHVASLFHFNYNNAGVLILEGLDKEGHQMLLSFMPPIFMHGAKSEISMQGRFHSLINVTVSYITNPEIM